MIEKRTIQASIFEHDAEHEIGQELKAMSEWLDNNRDLLEGVEDDIPKRCIAATGRKGLSVESVLRCAIDDRTFPKKTALQQSISMLSQKAWARINQRLAKKRMRAILYTRGMDKKARLYRDSIDVTEKNLRYLERVDRELRVSGTGPTRVLSSRAVGRPNRATS